VSGSRVDVSGSRRNVRGMMALLWGVVCAVSERRGAARGGGRRVARRAGRRAGRHLRRAPQRGVHPPGRV